MDPLRLRTTLHPRGPAAAVILDEGQVAALGGGAKTPPVRVTVNGYTFPGRVARMGGESLIGFNRAHREAAGVQPGDEVDVEIALDDQPREVELPEPLAEALAADAQARAAFEALSFTNRKEMARSIAEAKRPETRERRLAAALAELR
jgi:hypothetical protein